MTKETLPLVLWCCWLGGRKGTRPVKTEWWGAGMVICLEQGAGLHTAQLMPLPLTVSCSSKIQIRFTFLVPAHPGSPGQRTVKRMYSMYVCTMTKDTLFSDFLKSYCAVHNCCEWLIGISAKRTSTRGIVGCRLVLAGCWSESHRRAVPVWHHSQNPRTVHGHNGYYIFHLLYINLFGFAMEIT